MICFIIDNKLINNSVNARKKIFLKTRQNVFNEAFFLWAQVKTATNFLFKQQ